jgi:lipoprotein NlpD
MRIALGILAVLLLTGCGQKTLAPVVSAWHQPAAANSDYIVRKGDTLYSVAWNFGLDYRALAKINHLKPPYAIHMGQRLKMTTLSRLAPQAEKSGYSETMPATRQQVLPSKKPSRHSTAPQPALPTQVGRWQWPAKGRLVARFNPKPGGNHGIDISGRLGEPVVAAASGRVVYSGAGVRGYGNLIIIKHTNRYLSAYAFNQQNLVREGTSVRQGQTIARMGKDSAGSVLLHFEIRKDGRPVNPLNYLR